MAGISEFIKKPGTTSEYDQWAATELARCAVDPVYFINNYCWIQNQNQGKVRFKLRPYQERVIRCLHQNRFTILMIGRQCGKTETTAAYAYWFASFNENKNVLVASNKQKGATDIMNRIKFMYENTPDFIRAGVSFYNRGSVEFDNGSKIWSEATTETTGRGRSLALFLCDELAHVPRRIQEAMWSSILATISSGGSDSKQSCVVMSTPNGDSDLFATIWRGANSGTNGFVPIEVDISEVPGRDQKWQDEMRAKYGDLQYRQEFLCEFLSSDPLLIKSLVLAGLKGREPKYVDKGFSFWKDPHFSKTYLVSSDVAEGVEKDFSTVEVFELESMEQVAEFRSNTIKEGQLYNAIVWVIQKLLSYRDPKTGKVPQVYWSYENNSAGAAIGALYYADDKFPDAELISVSSTGVRIGMRTTNKTKLEACRAFKNLVEKKEGIKIHSDKLIFEMKHYIARGASYAAKDGATDDLVSACLVLMRMVKKLSEFEPEVFNKLYKEDGDFDDENSNDFCEPIPFTFN